jgi:hypothetical protein
MRLERVQPDRPGYGRDGVPAAHDGMTWHGERPATGQAGVSRSMLRAGGTAAMACKPVRALQEPHRRARARAMRHRRDNRAGPALSVQPLGQFAFRAAQCSQRLAEKAAFLHA